MRTKLQWQWAAVIERSDTPRMTLVSRPQALLRETRQGAAPIVSIASDRTAPDFDGALLVTDIC